MCAFRFQSILDLRQPVDGARIRCFGGDSLLRPDGGDDYHLVLHGVEDDHDRRPHQKRIGHADGIRLLRGQALDEAHRVIAQIAKDTRRHRRQMLRNIDAGCL